MILSDGITGSNPTQLPVARLGCGVHQLMPTFQKLTHSAFHRSITKSLGYSNPHVTQSQLIAKSAGIGGKIIAHQDGCASFTNPPSCLSFWYALEDATVENGCLVVARGSHLTEPVRQRLVKGEDGNPTFETLETPLWARGVRPAGVEVEQTEYEYELVEVKKGSMILFHGNLLHGSGRNQSEKGRMAYNFSVIEGDLDSPDDSYMKPVGGEFDLL